MQFKLFKSILKASRIGNLLMIALTQYLVAIFLVNGTTLLDVLYNWKMLAIVVSTGLIAAAGNIINDYYDIKIDLINKPEKVVVGKGLKRRKAMLLHSFFNISGIFLAYIVHWKLALVVLCSALLLWYYSNHLKRHALVGNLAVALLTGMSIVLIGLLYQQLNALVVLYALFAFFFNLIREIVKDIIDMSGDKSFGCKTLPILWGIRKTRSFILVITIVYYVLILSYAYWIQNWKVMVFSSLLIVPVSIIFYFLWKADTRKKFRYITKLAKLIMLVGVLSMVLWY